MLRNLLFSTALHKARGKPSFSDLKPGVMKMSSVRVPHTSGSGERKTAKLLLP